VAVKTGWPSGSRPIAPCESQATLRWGRVRRRGTSLAKLHRRATCSAPEI